MTGAKFKASIEKIYGTEVCQSAFARLIDVGDRTVRTWISGQYAVPKVVALLVNLMLKTKTKPEDLKAT
jgi:DNA-binding transcriptional regulator YiaG